MSKRGGEPTRGGHSKVKKRKNVKIRTTLIPDSDEETPALPNANSEYIRWVKTRVATSGDGSVTTSRIPLVDMPEAEDDPLLLLEEVDTDDATQEDTVRTTTTTRRRQMKSNDSVSCPLTSTLSLVDNDSDQDEIVA